jgi:hypothetical protein
MGLTLVMLALMSITPALASNHKDGDSYKEPEVTKPQEKPAAVEEKPTEVAKPPVSEEKAEEKEEVKPPAEPTWFACKKDYFRHLNSMYMDKRATSYMANVHSVAILPFFDQTAPSNQGQSMLQAVGGPRRMVENLASAFMKKGYFVIPPLDVESALDLYVRVLPSDKDETKSVEVSNNKLYFTSMPDRALHYYLETIPELRTHQKAALDEESSFFFSPEDIVNVSTMLGADCIVRGYVQEYAVETAVDSDFRTFFPPFLGLLKPEHRAFIEVAYYVYDGKSGQMIWNGTIDAQNFAEWPLFQTDNKILRDDENMVSSGVMDAATPNWQDIMMNHPKWIMCDSWDKIGCGMKGMGMKGDMKCEGMDGCKDGEMKGDMKCEGMDGCEGEGVYPGAFESRPDWINPMRHGWHQTHKRSKIDINYK